MFELLDHPADIGFRAFGATLAELFANSALALLNIATDPTAVNPREQYPLTVVSTDREALLVDWLSEVLYWFDGKQVAFQRVMVNRLEETALDAIAVGEPRDPLRHRSKLIVKAVTYHQLRIEQRPGGWMAEVFLDI
ncbi:MAG TPA: archease [Bryobacteraceae bacterium]|nr:archease [Bryobacteraceae bacterium]